MMMLIPLLCALVQPAGALIKELYSTNEVCRQQYCINPVFPALQELPKLEEQRWHKQSLTNVSKYLSFCSSFVNYDVALPMQAIQLDSKNLSGGVTPSSSKPSVKELVVAHDRQASKMYFYHLSGMGIEPWDHVNTTEDDSLPRRGCARSVARMMCYTYFPAALKQVKDGVEVRYRRPCSSSCESYVEACGVQCCDESTTCVWTAPHNSLNPDATGTPRRTQDRNGVDVFLYTGYVEDRLGRCTGGQSM
eukprot:TRINITY_DN41504_c0_g1_i1.p1 TRINITY_DN41504_c0_g1~~TRINITY_DN41504_c0_g1_i1.p1  ORF type:complete len:249 (-),score=33.42 TRINITY_DN41504_c0_g1_i1:85-831(-)